MSGQTVDRTLDALLDERAHLLIRINLLQDPDVASAGSLLALETRLKTVEAHIASGRAKAASKRTRPRARRSNIDL
jgi:hypothetical protein